MESIAFSPDSARLATGGDDRTAHVWALDKLEAGPAILAAHTDSVLDVAFSPDGRWLATGSGDTTLRLVGYVYGQTAQRAYLRFWRGRFRFLRWPSAPMGVTLFPQAARPLG